MSFLTEIISVANKIEVSTIVEKTPEIVLLIEETKRELLNYLDNVFIKYSQLPRYGTNLCEKINSAKASLSEVGQYINEVTKQDIGNVQNEINSCSDKLLETKEKIRILELLISINDNFINAKKLLKDGKHAETVNLIHVMKENMDLLQYADSLIILQEIKNEIGLLEVQLIKHMSNKIDQCIKYSRNGNKVYFNVKDTNVLQELFSAYTQWDDHIPALNDIAKFLWENILCPIVNSKVTVEVKLLENEYRLNIEISNENATGNYKQVFENLVIVIDYFEQHFKYSLESSTSLVYIGNDIRDNLSELLIKNCLNDTIPLNSEQLQYYSAVIKDVETLQSKLITSGFFSEDMNSLLDYATKVDEHYIRKKCQMYLKAAENIMKKDLHNMVEVGEAMDLNNPFKIDQDVFYQRSISKSCLELLEFTEDMLNQILKSSEPCSRILYHTAQTILAQYGDRVSEHHQKLLQTIPQQVALFLNNCTYLSFKVTSWNQVYGDKIKQNLNIEEGLFSSEAHRLNLIGNKMFEAFIEQQIRQMEQILKESGLINISGLDELEPITEKCIRQCLRQQELLRTVWHKVLSYSDYNKNLGITLNFLCKSIIDAVLQLKDISSTAGDQLVDVLKVIFTRGPKLFTDQKDVFIYVEQWHKLNELSFLLSSNLIEIADRWADGKGPLTLQFKSDELKQLIKALFQNTDRRAAVLAKIKEAN